MKVILLLATLFAISGRGLADTVPVTSCQPKTFTNDNQELEPASAVKLSDRLKASLALSSKSEIQVTIRVFAHGFMIRGLQGNGEAAVVPRGPRMTSDQFSAITGEVAGMGLSVQGAEYFSNKYTGIIYARGTVSQIKAFLARAPAVVREMKVEGEKIGTL